jgi:periplasmic protein TonB
MPGIARFDLIRMRREGAAAAGTRAKLGGFAVVMAVHAFVAAFLLQTEPVHRVLSNAVPIQVSLIPLPEVQRKPELLPQPLPVKPRIAPPRRPPPVLALPPPPDPFAIAPAMTVVAAAAPVLASPTEPYLPPAPPAPIPLTPPSFNADYLNNPPPVYPSPSRRAREEGKVVLRVFVSEVGLPIEVELKTSSGHARLDDTALNTVRHYWKFVPARRGERPVRAWVLVPISFSIRS